MPPRVLEARATRLHSPFPWFGAKGNVAAEIWARFGNPANYIEPFAGSLAVLLSRPVDHEWWSKNETVNDLDGNIANWHRAVSRAPDEVAAHASQPVNEVDLTSRHLWLVQNAEALRTRLLADPDFCDPRAAGWWVWGISCWVGGEWCTGIGPHTGSDAPSITNGGTAPGVYRKIPMVSGAHGGKGIHKPIPLQPDTDSPLGDVTGGIPDVAGAYREHLSEQFSALGSRLRRVRVSCGDWARVLGNAAVPAKGKQTAVFLDPPYAPTERRGDLYAVGDGRRDQQTLPVHEAARQWALSKTDDPAYRIAYCSYSTAEEDALFEAAGWVPYRWQARGGYGLAAHAGDTRARTNRDREVIWFSPSCDNPEAAPAAQEQDSLFDQPNPLR